MTTIVEDVTPRPAPPGWGLSTDLMPPEILDERRARTVRRLILILLTIMVLLCLTAFGMARAKAGSARADVQAAKARTTALQAKQRSYSGLVTLKGSISKTQSELASLLGADADLQQVIAQVFAAAPRGTTIQQLSLSIKKASSPSSNAQDDSGASVLDTSTVAHIGTLTLNGTIAKPKDVAAYLDALAPIKGVVQPYPGPISVSETGTQFSIAMTLNSTLLSHRYDTKGN